MPAEATRRRSAQAPRLRRRSQPTARFEGSSRRPSDRASGDDAEGLEGNGDLLDGAFGHARMQREREHFAAHTIGDGTVRWRRRGQRRLAGNRYGIVNQRLDAVRSEVALQRRAIRTEDGEEMVDMPLRRAPAESSPERQSNCRRYAAASARRSSFHCESQNNRTRRIAACISSRREFTPNSPW